MWYLSPSMILFTASGADTPGITSELTGILAKRNARVIDIAQAVIQNLLSLSILFEITGDPSTTGSQDQCLQELTKKAESLHLQVTVQVDRKKSQQERSAAKKTSQESVQETITMHYAVTLIADVISAQALHEVTQALANRRFNIDAIKRLSEGSFSCVEMIVSGEAPTSGGPSLEEFLHQTKAELLTIAQTLNVDIALQAEGLYRRAKRLVVFDMDSTLIQGEVIDELAREKGVYDEVAAITHDAMNGKMDFNESLRQRVAKLKGLSQPDLNQVLARIELTPGAEDLIGVLKKLGYKIALISGGFTFVADQLKGRLGLDHVYANQLEIQNGTLTGKTIGPIVNAQRKADLLDEIAQKEHIALDQVIAIGDGANDLLMLEKAGLGIAFNAKKTVREKADLSINQKNLRSVLYLLGLSEKDLAVCLTPKT
jgi:phosphoserine phosphatase